MRATCSRNSRVRSLRGRVQQRLGDGVGREAPLGKNGLVSAIRDHRSQDVRYGLAQRGIVFSEHDALIAAAERLADDAILARLLLQGIGQRFIALHGGVDPALLELVANIDGVLAGSKLHRRLSGRLTIGLAPLLDLHRKYGAPGGADLFATEIDGGLGGVGSENE